MPYFRVVLLLFVFSATLTPKSSAQSSGPEKTVSAINVETSTPRIDGRLDDDIWSNARWVSDFLQKEPVEGAQPSERTEVAIVFDSDALYVGARMFSKDPSTIRSLITRRDNETNAEQLAVSIDTYNNKRTAYTFAVTAGGVRLDYFHESDSQNNTDYSFNPVWTAETHIGAEGWTAEMRIPFSQLRFNEAPTQDWGININRQIPANNEDIFWIYVPKEETGWASRFGKLEGLTGIKPSRRLELLPYVASGGIAANDVDPQDPFRSDFETDFRAGLDAKIGLGSNLTLDATINPDFGQVEADPAEVNLTAFETFFSERRPFFTEGSDLLGGSHFYSRRIGTSPRGRVSGDFVDRPANTTILGAAKLSGRLASGFSIAALGAATQTENAKSFDLLTGTTTKTKVEPFAGYLAVAGSQEVGPNNSTLGFKVTGVQRAIDADDAVSSVLNDQAYSGELNWNARFKGGAYVIDGSLRGTTVSGTQERITRLQQLPVHYLQRPDADHVTLDTTRTSLNGYAFDIFASKNTGKVTAATFLGVESATYDPNDIGRLGRGDEIGWFAEVNFRQNTPIGPFHRIGAELSSFNGWNMGRKRNTSGFDTEVGFTWKNFWYSEVFAGFNLRGFSDTATRGGPRMAVSPERNIGIFARTNRAKRFYFDVFAFYEVDMLDRKDFRAGPEIAWQPNERVQLSFEPSYSKSIANRQYVATTSGGPAATFGSRYIFSNIDRSELATQFRLNYTFSPDLTLELYAEPFTASGKFYDFGELTAPESLLLREYGTDGTTITPDGNSYQVTDGVDTFSIPNRDFNFRSFRSNLVLRWEWRPGSTLFLVWQQDRSDFRPDGSFVKPASLLDSFGDPGDNFFSLKVSYWIPAG